MRGVGVLDQRKSWKEEGQVGSSLSRRDLSLYLGLVRGAAASLLACLGGSGCVMSDDLVLDPIVSRLRNDLATNQVVLRVVWAAVDDLLRQCVPDSRKLAQFVFAGSVDIELRALAGFARRTRALLRFGAGG